MTQQKYLKNHHYCHQRLLFPEQLGSQQELPYYFNLDFSKTNFVGTQEEILGTSVVGNSSFGEELLCYAAFSVSNILGCCLVYWKSFRIRIMNIIFNEECKVRIFSSFLLNIMNFELDCQGILLKGLLYSCSFTILIERFLMKSCFLFFLTFVLLVTPPDDMIVSPSTSKIVINT